MRGGEAGAPGDAPPVSGCRSARAADGVVFLLFLAVPLAACPWFWDQFTSVKWYVLEALTATWFLVELWGCGSGGWPAFVRQRWPACLSLVVLVVGNSLRSGAGWAAPALLDRLAFVLLALAGFWYFRRNRGSTRWILRATGVATGLVLAIGLAQVLGRQPLSFLTAGDHRSATFGNVNMAAQYLGFAVILLVTGSRGVAASRSSAVLREAVVLLSFVYLYFLSCRSVFVALAVASASLLLSGRLRLRSLVRMLGLATVVIALLLRYTSVPAPARASTPGPGGRAATDKATSTAMRLEVWKATLVLIRNHPFGVGSANFGDAFIPYQLGLPSVAGEAVLFRTPHNEYLRAVAEDGVLFAVLTGGLLLSLIRDLVRAPERAQGGSERRTLLVAGGAFLAVEAFFQFPFGTAVGSLVAAALLGLALATLEAPDADARAVSRSALIRWRVLGTIAAVVSLALLARVATSEWLFVNRNREVLAQDAACRLDPRNLPACVTGAWLRAGAGERREARVGLVRVLQRSPYYYPAILMLGEIAAADGDRRGACLYLWVYDQLFRGRGSAHSRLGSLCGGTPPINVPAGMPYYGTMPLAERDVDSARREPSATGSSP